MRIIGKIKKSLLKKGFRGELESEEEIEEYLEYLSKMDETFHRQFREELRDEEKWECLLSLSEQYGIEDLTIDDIEIVGDFVVTENGTYEVTPKGLKKLESEEPSDEEKLSKARQCNKLQEICAILREIREDTSMSEESREILSKEILDCIEETTEPIEKMDLERIKRDATERMWERALRGGRIRKGYVELGQVTPSQQLGVLLMEGELRLMKQWERELTGQELARNIPRCPVCMQTPPFERLEDESGRPILRSGKEVYLTAEEHMKLRHPAEYERYRHYKRYKKPKMCESNSKEELSSEERGLRSLALIFKKELFEEKSSKKSKKTARKSRVPNAAYVES